MTAPTSSTGPVQVFPDDAARGAVAWELGDLTVLETTRVLEMWDGTNWVQVGGAGAAGPKGDPGEVHFEQPSITGAVVGAPASVVQTGQGTINDPFRLHFSMPIPERGPKGDAGADGTPAVFARPVVTLAAPGTVPAITQSGSGTVVDPYVIHLTLPYQAP